MFAADDDEFDGKDGVGVVESLHALVCATQAEMLLSLDRVHRSQEWADASCLSMAHWVALRFGVTRRTARLWLEAGEVLTANTVLADAYAQGRVSFDHLGPLGVLAAERPETDWVAQVPVTSVAQFEQLARACRSETDPPVPVAKSVFSLRPDATNTSWKVRGTFTSIDGELVLNVLEAIADKITPDVDDAGVKSWPSADEKLAMALVELATAGGIDMLMLVCSFHHRMIHLQGWEVRGSPDDGWQWIRPDGTPAGHGPQPPPWSKELRDRYSHAASRAILSGFGASAGSIYRCRTACTGALHAHRTVAVPFQTSGTRPGWCDVSMTRTPAIAQPTTRLWRGRPPNFRVTACRTGQSFASTGAN